VNAYLFRDASDVEKLSRRTCGQSIAELESLIESKNATSHLAMSFPHDIHQRICNAIGYETEIKLFVPLTGFIHILDSVRTIILKWTLKLEEDGIFGEGLSFSSIEKQTATEHAYHVNHFYGSMPGLRIEQDGPDQSTHFHASVRSSNITIHSTDVHQSIEFPDELSNLFSQMISVLKADTSLTETQRNELVSDVETLKAELKRRHPRTNMIGTIMSTLGDVSSVTSFIMQITPYLPHLHL
jgi:hypothetical protein